MNDDSQELRTADVSIVIVTWNAKELILKCLHSLTNINLSAEIIVVDNASIDGTEEAILRGFPDVVFIENDTNMGFAKANNIGVRIAKGRYICLINSDVVVPPGTIERMFQFMEDNPSVGLLGPIMRSPNGSVGQSVMLLPTVWNSFCCALGLHRIFARSKVLGGFEARGYSYDHTEDVEVLTGWFWMARHDAVEQIGPLDEQFFMYGEDIDWCYRFRKAGWRLMLFAEAEALHYGAASSSKQPVRFYIEMKRANLQCFRKHHGDAGWICLLLITGLHEFLRVIGYMCILPFKQVYRRQISLKIEKSLACIAWLTRIRSIPINK